MKPSLRFSIIIIGSFLMQFAHAQETYELLFIKGSYDEILKKSSKLSSPDDYFWHSLMLDRKGETLNSISFLKEGIEKYPLDTILEKLLTDYLYKTGQYVQAKPLLHKYSDNPEVFLKLINVLGFDEDYRTGIKYINERISTDSLNIELLSQLGDFYQQIGALESSIQIFKKLIEINPNDQKSAIRLITLYIKTKKYDLAVETCDTFLLINPESIKLHTLKGVSCYNLDDFNCSYHCFDFLHSKGDSGKFVLKHLGISEFKIEFFEESMEHLLKAYKKDSIDKETIFFLGKLYSMSETPVTGLYYFNLLDTLMQPDPKILSTIYNEKQEIYTKLGNYEEALNCYLMAYSYDPKPQYLFFIASAYQSNFNDKKKALEYYEKFIEQLSSQVNTEARVGKSTSTISLKGAAEYNIRHLREELFFEGEN